MRLISLLFALAILGLGIVFGALNPAPVRVDLYWGAFELALGPALLLAAFVGALLGGIALIVGVVLPLSRRHSRLRAEHNAAQNAARRNELVLDEQA